jgi:hypothetical protein
MLKMFNEIYLTAHTVEQFVDSTVYTRDAPDIRPDNPAFFDSRYSAGYQIALPDIRPDSR